MFGTGVTSKLKALDVYRKLPQDLTEPTVSGALVSILSTIIMLLLFITELNTFLQVQVVSEMFIDVNRGGEKLQVNLDLVLPRLPCDILSLDAQDIMGSHHVNVGGHLYKRRLDRNGGIISEEIHTKNEDGHDHSHDHAATFDLGKVKEALAQQQGCQLFGYILVNKVPGNFHISAHAFGQFLQQLFAETGIKTLDLSHTINHISFGQDKDLTEIKKIFQRGVLNPIDGIAKIKPENLRDVGVMHQYYINVVPTTYEDLSGKQLFVHQFTANSNEINTYMLPALYFRYDLSPITVKFAQKKESFFHFLVQICAIIGGIFTVAGIIDSLIHKSVASLLKKAQEGKLS